MVEAEHVRVQREAPERVALAAVAAIAGDGMARPGEVDANLIAASGLEAHLEQRLLRAAGDDAPVGDRGPPALRIARLAYASGLVVDEAAPDRALTARDAAVDERQVDPLRAVRAELRLKRLLRGRGGGEDEEPGREAVEAVHDEHTARRPPRPQVAREVRVHGPPALALG